MKETFKEKQAEWVRKNRVTIGDSVRVTRRAGDHENGWMYVWVSIPMNSAVGKVGTVKEIRDDCIELSIPGIQFDYLYPYFVLEKVDPEQPVSVHKEWEVSYGLKARTGDPVLVRDIDELSWRYSFLSHKDPEDSRGMPFSTTSGWFKHCVPYIGNEHLVGTCDKWEAPAAETEKKDFRFGAKVQIQIGDKTWEGVMLDYDEQDDSYEIARRDSENTKTRRIWVGANKFTYVD